MTINDLVLITILLICGFALWQHLDVSRLARLAAIRHTEKYGVVLLDQNVVLRRLRICRSRQSLFAVERRYHFEFSSVGDTRYDGEIIFRGKRLAHVELQPFRAD